MKEYSCLCTVTVDEVELKRLLETCDSYFTDGAKKELIRSVIFTKNHPVFYHGLVDKILQDYKDGKL